MKIMKKLKHFALAAVTFSMFMGMGISANAADSVTINETNFEDPVFREYVKEFDENHNGKLENSELANVYEIFVENMNISSLKGIENFYNLNRLFCSNNNIKSLDVSSFDVLQVLDCYNNALTSLDVTNNKYLKELVCADNNIQTLDVTMNYNLEELYCGNCGLTTIDVLSNKKLVTLSCMENSLTSLDLTYNSELINLYCDHCPITSLDLSSVSKLSALICNNCPIDSLDLSIVPDLKLLRCYDCNMTKLNVSQNKYIGEIYCWGNKFSSVKLSSVLYDDIDCSPSYCKDKYTIRYNSKDKTIYIKNEPDPGETTTQEKTTEQPDSQKNVTKVKAPAKVKISSVKNNKKKTITVKWKKIKSVKGYEVQYALNKKFTKSCKKKTTKKISLAIKKLKKKKTYYVRVRAYRVDSNGNKKYGKWSTVKKVKIKK